jgi:molybdopterin synthase sulfur carrier subunit
MAVKILIPTPLQKLTGGNGEVTLEAANVAGAVAGLEAQFPGIRERLCDDSGKLRRFVNVYLNNEDIRFLENEETALKDGDELSIIPAIAGGNA